MEAAVKKLDPAKIELSVVIPAYREEENLRILLPRIISVVDELTPFNEIIVVDTMTPLDSTREVCETLDVRYCPRSGSNSFGSAVRTGIAASRGENVIFMDADGSHAPEFIAELYAHRADHDVVVASRYVDGGHTENPASLVWMSWFLNLTYRLVLGLKCHDVSNSFKMYRGDQLRSLTLRCENFDIVEEILFRLHRKFDVTIEELPFTFRKRMFGETKRNLVLFVATYLFTMIRLRLSR